MTVKNLQCEQAVECRNNRCVLRRVQVLGLPKTGDSKCEYDLDRRYGKALYPDVKSSGFGLVVSLECGSFE